MQDASAIFKAEKKKKNQQEICACASLSPPTLSTQNHPPSVFALLFLLCCRLVELRSPDHFLCLSLLNCCLSLLQLLGKVLLAGLRQLVLDAGCWMLTQMQPGLEGARRRPHTASIEQLRSSTARKCSSLALSPLFPGEAVVSTPQVTGAQVQPLASEELGHTSSTSPRSGEEQGLSSCSHGHVSEDGQQH